MIAAFKALRVISDDEAENVELLDIVPEDQMTAEQLREALRRARRVCETPLLSPGC
jgi:hypothetical protein